MNKKEIAEIKKQLTPDRCAISRICGCYVDGEKNIITSFRDTFLALPEEEIFKYFEIFRKTLSGTIGKNLLTMEFPLDTEKDNGTQQRLLALRKSELKDDTLLQRFYQEITESFYYPGNYLILLIYAAYDVPGQATDELDQFDASDEVYTYMMTCICPVSLAKPALSYDAEEKCFHNRIRDWVVEMPLLGFLFPAFNDRCSDIHSLLYYTKDGNDLHDGFIDGILGCRMPLAASAQKDVFADLIEESLKDGCDFEMVQSLHIQLHEIREEQKDSPDPVALGKGEMKNLLERAGAGSEQVKRFDERFDEVAGRNEQFMLSNITSVRKFEVKTPEVVIQVNPDRSDLIEEKVVDGRKCFIIPITDEVQVNGIRVRPH